jgi:hypothetical protein
MKDATVNPRIERLFEHTKLLCFGRYVLTVPVDSRLAFGRDFPTLPNQAKDIEKIMKAERVEDFGSRKDCRGYLLRQRTLLQIRG